MEERRMHNYVEEEERIIIWNIIEYKFNSSHGFKPIHAKGPKSKCDVWTI